MLQIYIFPLKNKKLKNKNTHTHPHKKKTRKKKKRRRKRTRRFSNHESCLLSGSPTFAITVILIYELKGILSQMTSDPIPVKIISVNLPKDHYVQVS